MLNFYYMNRNQQPNSDYEVHCQNCDHGALPENQISLGQFTNCVDAVAAAKRQFIDVASQINGCYYCCNPCHTG